MRRGALALVLALAAGACGGGGPSSRAIVVAAPARTMAQKTSSVELDVGVTGGRAATSFHGQGVFDYQAGRGRIDFDLSSLGLTGSRGLAQMLLLGDVIFVKLPVDTPELSTRPWVKVDVNKLGEQSGINLASLRQLQNNDPTVAMQFLRGAAGVKKVGKEKVRGVETTHYRTTLDLLEVRKRVPADVKDDVTRIVDQLGARRLPTEAWVDAGGRLRKLEQTIDLSKATTPGLDGQVPSGIATTVFELHDFGVKVDVQEPPPDQVSDLASLVAGGGSG